MLPTWLLRAASGTQLEPTWNFWLQSHTKENASYKLPCCCPFLFYPTTSIHFCVYVCSLTERNPAIAPIMPETDFQYRQYWILNYYFILKMVEKYGSYWYTRSTTPILINFSSKLQTSISIFNNVLLIGGRMSPVGSYICMLSLQLVYCLEGFGGNKSIMDGFKVSKEYTKPNLCLSVSSLSVFLPLDVCTIFSSLF